MSHVYPFFKLSASSLHMKGSFRPEQMFPRRMVIYEFKMIRRPCGPVRFDNVQILTLYAAAGPVHVQLVSLASPVTILRWSPTEAKYNPMTTAKHIMAI